MTYENYVKGRLYTFAIAEAAHLGGVTNMLAVAQVIANRVQAGWFGGDWEQVLDHAPEVSATAPGTGSLGGRDPIKRALLQLVDDVYHCTATDQTEQALYFAELHEISRPWFLENVSREPAAHPRVAQIGMVTFFQ